MQWPPPSLHLPIFFWVFIPFFYCELLTAGLSLVYDVPPFWVLALPTEYTDLTFHLPKLMSNFLCHNHHHAIFLSVIWGLSWGFKTLLFYRWGCQPCVEPPTWKAGISFFVWVITFDLSGLGYPTSSYTTASVALRVIWPQSPPLCQSKCIFRVPFLCNSV